MESAQRSAWCNLLYYLYLVPLLLLMVTLSQGNKTTNFNVALHEDVLPSLSL